ncbi:toll-like receptor 4 [Argopecten irradians]|uniref:toll-like receptor 4 n=1 Tax=Argopecten irradians TaxID=31199 RepID=UPI003720BA4C
MPMERLITMPNRLLCLYSVLVITNSIARENQNNCPKPCKCTYKRNIIDALDCSNLQWKALPSEFIFPSSVTHLSLAQNLFEVLLNSTFSNLRNLQSLNISHNRLSRMDYSCFEGLESLTTLDISYNELEMTTNVYTPGIFRHLKNLKVLNIHGNVRQSTIGQNYPDVALSDLKMLEVLKIDGIRGVIFGDGFQELKHLKILDMTSRHADGFCELIDVYNTTFSSLSNSTLSVLKLVQCSIYRIAPGAFSMLSFLTELDLSENNYIAFDGMRNASFGLNSTNIRVLRLNAINKHSDPWTLKYEDFVYFTETNLKTLTLHTNRITKIDKEVMNLLPTSLENISLRDNILTDAKFLQNINLLKNLVVLDISYQLDYSATHDDIRTQHNVISWKDQKQFTEKAASNTNLFRKKILDYPQGTYTGSSSLHPPNNPRRRGDIYPLPTKLRKIFARSLKLGTLPVPALTFDSNNSVEYVDLSSNGLPAWYGQWSGLHSLRVFNISFNGIFHLAPDTFGDMANLHSLFLNGNRLGKAIMQDKHFLTFSNQTKLTYLNLSDNGLTDLPKYIFARQSSLEKLEMQDNLLSAINFQMKSLERIKEINLSNNTIKDLTHVNMEEIDYLGKRSNFTIDLTGNPLLCTCDQLEQLRWMADSKPVFRNLKQYICKANNDSLVRLQWLDDLVREMEIDCIAEEVILICAVVFCGLCFILALAALAYYKTSRLMYLFSVGRKHYNPLGTITPKGTNIQDGEDEQMEFTVYFSMEPSLDMNEFAGQLKEHLQNKDISVCIPELDIKVGVKETVAIVHAMNNSACILALIDNRYMTSFQRLFEFEVAVSEGIQNRFNNLIVVLLKDLDSKHLQMNDIVAMFCRENHFFDGRKSQGRLFGELENEIIRYKEFIERKK